MLKKTFRLPAQTRFDHPSSFHLSSFSLLIQKNGLLYTRFGFVVSKKVDKRAVVRNTVKRQLRSCIEALQADIAPGFDMLFVIKKAAVTQSTKVLGSQVQAFLQTKGYIQ